MAKKITLNLWVEPATNAGNYSIFLDNIEEFIRELNKYGVPDLNEASYDIEIVDAEAKFDE